MANPPGPFDPILVYRSDPDRLLVQFTYSAGLRVGEIVRLKREDIVWNVGSSCSKKQSRTGRHSSPTLLWKLYGSTLPTIEFGPGFFQTHDQGPLSTKDPC